MIKKVLLIFSVTIGIFAQTVPVKMDLSTSPLAKISVNNDDRLLSNSITDILVVGDTIWLGTTRGLSQSTDHGTTWNNYYNSPEFEDEGIVAMAYANSTIFVSTGHSENLNGQDIQTGSGIHYSTNNGSDWNTIPQPIDEQGDSLITYGINTIRALPIIVKQQNISFGMSAFGNSLWIASWAGGVRKTTDLGQTWDRIILPPDNLDEIKPTDTLSFSLQVQAGNFGLESYLNHLAFSVLAVDDTLIYAGTAGGINQSSDGGISWKKFNNENTGGVFPGNWVTALAYDNNTNVVWAGAWRAESSNEIYAAAVTRDNGNSWESFLPAEKIYSFGFSSGLNGIGINSVFACSDNGIFRTTDDGSNWINPGKITDPTTNLQVLSSTIYSVGSTVTNNEITYWIGTSGNGLVKFIQDSPPWNGNWEINLSSEKLKDPEETYAFPNPFAPDQEVVKIKYQLSNNSTVSIRVMDFGMNLVKTIIQNVTQVAGEHFEIWNGRDEFGNYVTNGVYFYRVDTEGNDPIYNKIMVLR
ncbi:MAG: hypothetical protein K9J12_07060 [Melioribacteraceae bacterium]|nr:hypothetical protein [Melioribacteraceae bacterium]MCF8431308.1 hypothetical protein [Melioribacteraceae bacterium]